MQDVIVVGGGVVGLCSAWALARSGRKVRVLEQGPLPNPRQSSYDDHRLIRYPYGASEGYARMVAEAYGAWDRLWADLGATHYRETGTLALRRADDDWADRSLAVMAALGMPMEPVDPREAAVRFPDLRLPDDATVWFHPTGGVLYAARIVEGLLRLLPTLGVDLRPDTPVLGIDADRGEVRTAAGPLRADHLVVTTGAWTGRLLPELAGRITPSRQTVALFETGPQRPDLPMLLDLAPGRDVYLVPGDDRTPLKIGLHGFTRQGGLDGDREPDPDILARVRAWAAERIAWPVRPIGGKACFYGVTDDEAFIARHADRLTVLAGLSGHGFKFGAVLGEAVAQVVRGEQTAERFARWAAGLATRSPGA